MSARILAVLLAAMLGCGQTAREGKGAESDLDDPSSGDDGAPAGCLAADECVAVASTCCECPTFAVSLYDDYADSCDSVDCMPEAECPRVEATCGATGCELVCSPVVTARQCDGGFARDAFGCLLDECASPRNSPASCLLASDCVRVTADCCGCARGGEDTAVPVGEVDTFSAELGCTGAESCPGVDLCEQGEPACVGGECMLMVSPTRPEGHETTYCGTPDYPMCPLGTVCLLNSTSAEGGPSGVGVCQAP